MDAKLKRRLEKLLALAERGVDGEKETAQRMLSKTLEKHGISLQQISDEAKKTHWIRYSGGKFFKSLLAQIIYSVCDDEHPFTQPNQRNKVGIRATKAELVEIELKHLAYKKGLEEQLELTFSAFIHKHHLFGKSDDDNEPEELTPEKLKRLERLERLISATPSIQVNKALEQSQA